MTIVSDGKRGIRPNRFNDWQTENFKELKKLLIEYFSFLNNGTEVESAKTFPPTWTFYNGDSKHFITMT